MGDFLPDNGFVLRFFALMGVKMGVKLFTYSGLLFGADRGVPALNKQKIRPKRADFVLFMRILFRNILLDCACEIFGH